MAQATKSLSTIAALALLLGSAEAQAPDTKTKTIWSIWGRNITQQACGDFAFVWSYSPEGRIFSPADGGGYNTPPVYPYERGDPITVIGWSVTQRLSDPTAIGSWVIGSATNYAAGADVFASGGGIGTNSSRGFFPTGTGLPQGGTAWANSRFDLYGKCDKGTQGFDVVIYYTSP